MGQALTIGQVAQATGVTAKTIRYYEQAGVLPPPGRSRAGYRQYTQQGVDRLLFIRRARALGLSLRHLKTLSAALDGRSGMVRPQLRDLVHAQLSAVQRRIGELQLLQRELEQVQRRLRAPVRPRPTGPCRCLEIGSR